MDAHLDASLLGARSVSKAGPVEEKSSTYKLIWAMLMLFSGTFCTIFGKAMFETKGVGTESCDIHDDSDYNCAFNKPWFTVLVMKLSMALCLPLYYGFGAGKEDPDAPSPSWKTIKKVAFPASFDLLNTILGNIGLMYVNSSIYQMTRGSVVIFSAIISVKFLGRTLRSFHYWAIFFVMIAVVVVGLAGIEEDAGDSSSDGGQVFLGLGFILLAQAVTAVQFLTEEALMIDKTATLDPVALVGFEGLWGLLFFAVLAPILTFTPRSSLAISIVWHEDFGDTFTQLSNSSDLCWLSFGYFCMILMYNVSANFVTQCLSAVVRSILEACRVMGVWLVGLMFFYFGTSGMQAIGEQGSEWSYLELCGFLVLMYGTFAYKTVVKLPWVAEEEYALAKMDEREATDKREALMGSVTYNALTTKEDDEEEVRF
jgi:drug/metabolite transporter (DMT)-like permease